MKPLSVYSPRRHSRIGFRAVIMTLAVTPLLYSSLMVMAPGQAQEPPADTARRRVRPSDTVLLKTNGAVNALLDKAKLIPSLPAALAAYEEPYKGKPDKALNLLSLYLKNTGIDKEIENADVTVLAIPNLAWGHAPTSVFQPAEANKLKTLLRDHIIRGSYTYDKLMQAVSDQGGTARLTTLSGAALSVRRSNGVLMLEGSASFNSNDPFDADKAGRWPRFRRSYLLIRKGREVAARRGAGLVIDDFLKPSRPVRID